MSPLSFLQQLLSVGQPQSQPQPAQPQSMGTFHPYPTSPLTLGKVDHAWTSPQQQAPAGLLQLLTAPQPQYQVYHYPDGRTPTIEQDNPDLPYTSHPFTPTPKIDQQTNVNTRGVVSASPLYIYKNQSVQRHA